MKEPNKPENLAISNRDKVAEKPTGEQEFEPNNQNVYWIDTHCHFDLLKKTASEVITLCQEGNVRQMITISVEPSSFAKVLDYCHQYPQLYGSLGVHPHDAKQFNEQVEIDLLHGLQQSKKIIAIGETGLDYHYMHSTKEEQRRSFQRQLEIATEVKLPLVLHTREAEEDTMEILRRVNPPCHGVAHSFTSSVKMAAELLEMGWSIGFNGIVTFPKAEQVREVVRMTPLDRLLIETDAPYLTPVPFRGRPNDSTRIPIIGQYLAQFLGQSDEHLARITTQNAIKLFKLEPVS